MQTVAVIGASGAVGSEIVRLLEVRNFPLRELRCFSRSANGALPFRGEAIRLEKLSDDRLRGVDLAFFAAGSSVSKEWIPNAGCLCIDSSSAFRATAPLVIPEINAHALREHRGVVASPNCAATILLLPLAPLHRRFCAKRVIVSTYQAASGGGAHLMRHLQEETRAVLEHRTMESFLPFPYAFNVFPHLSAMGGDGYVEEEKKLHDETRKILEDEQIAVTATCVRVPVLRAHSLSANVEFMRPFRSKKRAKSCARRQESSSSKSRPRIASRRPATQRARRKFCAGGSGSICRSPTPSNSGPSATNS